MIVKLSKLEIDFLASDLVRSPGLHASDIYNDLFKHLEPKRYDIRDKQGVSVPLNPILLALGTAWEKHLEYLLIKNGVTVERPDEFIDPDSGVAFSPDLIFFTYEGETRLGEMKLTSMSHKDMPTEETNHFPPKFNKYMCQMKLYCHFLNVRLGWLAVLFLHEPWNPQFRMFDIEFTDPEVNDNAAMCMNHARHAGLLKG